MSSATFAPGYVFDDDFRVERLLAAGGMGEVYLVKQLSTGRSRALKTMHTSLAQDDEARRRFLLEARVGSRIPSSHIVEIVAAGFDQKTPYLVMELLEGEDLGARLRRGPFDFGETHELFRQLCHGVGAAHGAGVIHRDLKPANIFLAERRSASSIDMHVKVLDFGLAKLTQEWLSLAASRGGVAVGTLPGGIVGTPRWMAPEQSENIEITPAADVWALGLILYTATTGRSFWRFEPGAPLSDVMREVLFEPLPSATARARQQGVVFPELLEPIFRACVARDPSARFRDATSLWLALDAALQRQAGPRLPPAPRTVPPATERLPVGDSTLSDSGKWDDPTRRLE